MSDSDIDSFYGGFSDSDSEVSIAAAGYDVPDEPVDDMPNEYLSNSPVNYFSESEEEKDGGFMEQEEQQDNGGFMEETPLVSLMSGIKKLEI